MPAYTYIELFAGAGGASLGLHAAGFRSLLAVEWDSDACATRRAAWPDRVFEGDVRQAPVEGLGHVDLLWASPPCQAWSTAGKRLGAFDERNGWPWTWEALDRLTAEGSRPTWVVCENVRGILMHRATCEGDDVPEDCPRCYWDQVVLPAFQQRYEHVSYRVLNAADYGVPQVRRRVFLVAGPAPFAWPEPTHSFDALVHAKWRTGDYWARHGIPAEGAPSAVECRVNDRLQFVSSPSTLPWRTVRDVIEVDGRVQGRSCVSEGDVFAVFGAGDVELFSSAVMLDRPSDTLAAQPNGRAIISATRERRATWTEQTGRRRHSLRDCAVLQGFPADHPFQGPTDKKFKQVGNAVAPPVAEVLGRVVRSLL